MNREKQKYDVFKPFSEQVDDMIAGRIPKGTDLLIGRTSAVLRRIGLSNLPMTASVNHMKQVYESGVDHGNVHYHALGELLKQLPEALEDPVAVIRATGQRGGGAGA